MKKIIATLFATTMLAGTAIAADLPSRKAAPVLPPPSPLLWQGAYVGGNVGGGWMNGGNGQVWSINPNTWANTVWSRGGSSNAGVIGGVQVGYNYQVSPMFVVGAEADFQGSSLGGGYNSTSTVAAVEAMTGDVVGYTGASRVNWFGTVRGRLGIVPLTPALMVYGTGGFAYGDVSRSGTYGGATALQTGWTAGGGVEYKFTPNWSTKVEYLYTEISGGNQNKLFNSSVSLNNVNNRTSWNTIRAGVNYHFNSADIVPAALKF